MKAIIYETYGMPEVLQYTDRNKPAPQPDEILIKVHASSINAADRYTMLGKPRLMRLMIGFMRPKDQGLGKDVAGVVEAIGSNVTDFVAGDRVFGEISGGAYAQYVCAPAKIIAKMPDNVAFEQAAMIPLAGFTALQGLRDKAELKPGQRVLINGATGGVGVLAVQMAKAMGAHVTATTRTSKLDLLRSLEPDVIIDYKTEDVTKGDYTFDVIYDVGAYRLLREYKRILSPTGTYVLCGGDIRYFLRNMIHAQMLTKKGGQTFKSYVANVNRKDLIELARMLQNGTLAAVIDKRYPLSELASAMRYFNAGNVRGKVAIIVE